MVDVERQVLEVIRRVAAEQLDFQGTIEPQHALQADLQLDSLGLTIMAVELENHFQLKLSEDDAARITTVGELTRHIARRVAP
jgi:acyl carrier protein